jgi:hypothetical protein
MIFEYLQAGNERANQSPTKFPGNKLPPLPTMQDYDKGFFERYFIRQKNTDQIFEVSRKEFLNFQDNRFFVPFSLEWKISGPRTDVFNDAGYPVRTGVEDTNRRILETINQRGIEEKLNDLLQYWDGRDRNPRTDR